MILGLLQASLPELNAAEVLDSRLQLDLFAESPQIVTPTGLVAGDAGRVWVIENHTHQRPAGYTGPSTDRVVVLEDTIGDGRADSRTVFQEGFQNAMDLGRHPDGSLFLVARDGVFRMRDDNQDQRADQVQQLVRMRTGASYPHNGMSGVNFDAEGRVYFTLGENRAQRYEMMGRAGERISGGGGVGAVFRCRPDGSELERIATGFWNPFGLEVDPWGRVWVVDNDPGDRPPCRLLNIVPGGDYGYRRDYNPGTHPFIAWNGELPNTLPMVTGVGEGPSEVVWYSGLELPEEYRNRLLVTSWSDHRVESHAVRRVEGGWETERRVLVQGGNDFRPVGLSVATDGSVYFSDWGDGSYPVHGKGRLWRLRGEGKPASKPVSVPSDSGQFFPIPGSGNLEDWLENLAFRSQAEGLFLRWDRVIGRLAARPEARLDWRRLAESRHAPEVRALALAVWLERGGDPEAFTNSIHPPALREVAGRALRWPVHQRAILRLLEEADPYVRQSAVEGLRRSGKVLLSPPWELLESSDQRTGWLAALRGSGLQVSDSVMRRFLMDRDAAVQMAVLRWISDQRLQQFEKEVGIALRQDAQSTPELVMARLAVLDRLAKPEPPERTVTELAAMNPRDFLQFTDFRNPQILAGLVRDSARPASVRVAALRLLPTGPRGLSGAEWIDLARTGSDALRMEAVKGLVDLASGPAWEVLRQIAGEPSLSDSLRAEAVLALAQSADSSKALFLRLARGPSPVVAEEALRGLIGWELDAADREALEGLRSRSARAPFAQRLLGEPPAGWPPPGTEVSDWLQRLPDTGDSDRGERLFRHPRLARCSGCHEVDGQGTAVGPNLSRIGSAMNREQLLEALLTPSREIAPQYQAWRIETKDGEERVGLGLTKGGTLEAYLGADGKRFTVRVPDLVRREESTVSLMPEGLLQTFTPGEVADLLAYLESRR